MSVFRSQARFIYWLQVTVATVTSTKLFLFNKLFDRHVTVFMLAFYTINQSKTEHVTRTLVLPSVFALLDQRSETSDSGPNRFRA